MSVFSCKTMGGVGRWVVDDAEFAIAEGGAWPITMGIHTEGGRDEINEVDWAAAVVAASVEVW